jgi:hypothetical protein
MKLFIMGFLISILFLLFIIEYGKYKTMMNIHKPYDPSTEVIVDLYIPSYLPVHHFLESGYLAPSFANKCSTTTMVIIKDHSGHIFKESNASWYGCDRFQILLNDIIHLNK